MNKYFFTLKNIEKTMEMRRTQEVFNKASYETSDNKYHSTKACDIEKALKTNFTKGLSKSQVDIKIR